MKTAILLLIYSFSTPILKAQEKSKDTLFFNYNNGYIRTYAEIPHHFYLNDSSDGRNGSFFFKEGEIKNNLNPKKIMSLKRFIRSSEFYNKKKNLKDDKLAVFLSNYIVFLVKNTHKKVIYIQVQAGVEIE